MAGRVEFDILAHDHASGTLARIGQAFRKISRDADDSGRDTGKGFGTGLKKWFSGSGVGLFGQLGRGGGAVFGSGLLGALRTPVLGPLIIGAAGAAVATAMPIVGGIAATGLIAGLGAGLAGLGIFFAAKSAVVKQVWTDTLTDMGQQMSALSQPFEATLVSMAGIFRRTFDAFTPYLSKAFAKMAGPIEGFADQAGKALEQLAPAIKPVTDGFIAVLNTLGPALQSAVGNVTVGLTNLAHSVEASPDALADMTIKVGELSKGLLDFTAGLNTVYGGLKDVTSGVSAATGGLVTIGGVFSTVKNAVNPLGGALGLAKDGITSVGAASGTAGQSMNAAADAVTRNAQAMAGNSAAARGLVGPLGAVSNALANQKLQFTAAIAAMSQWNTKALAGSNAAIAYEAAVDDASAAVKNNGRTLDINTEKGRANRTALNNVAAAANNQTAAMDAAGASNKAVAAKAASARDAFVKLATKMGLSAGQARALAASLINIPNVSRTVTVTYRNITYNDVINRTSTGQFQGGINAQPRAAGGLASGWSLVGERGPELVHFSTPAKVTPAGESSRMMRSTTTVTPTVIDARTARGGDRYAAEWLASLIRTNPALKQQIKVLLS